MFLKERRWLLESEGVRERMGGLGGLINRGVGRGIVGGGGLGLCSEKRG
jgi:hypothetical protein